MKRIPMHELIVGDVWTKEIKIISREAFEVIQKTLTSVIVVSRNDDSKEPKRITKAIKGNVIALRNTQTGEKYHG
jgi:hypothetical protein